MADLMQQARELLAAEYESRDMKRAAHQLRYGYAITNAQELAMNAIAAALRAAPEGYVLVPVQTLESIRDSSTDPVARGFAEGALAARPKGVKDAT